MVFLIGGFTLPLKVAVERSTFIRATPGQISPSISSFKNGWIHWDPFRDKGNLTVSYHGPDEGVGLRCGGRAPPRAAPAPYG